MIVSGFVGIRSVILEGDGSGGSSVVAGRSDCDGYGKCSRIVDDAI